MFSGGLHIRGGIHSSPVEGCTSESFKTSGIPRCASRFGETLWNFSSSSCRATPHWTKTCCRRTLFSSSHALKRLDSPVNDHAHDWGFIRFATICHLNNRDGWISAHHIVHSSSSFFPGQAFSFNTYRNGTTVFLRLALHSHSAITQSGARVLCRL